MRYAVTHRKESTISVMRVITGILARDRPGMIREYVAGSLSSLGGCFSLLRKEEPNELFPFRSLNTWR